MLYGELELLAITCTRSVQGCTNVKQKGLSKCYSSKPNLNIIKFEINEIEEKSRPTDKPRPKSIQAFPKATRRRVIEAL